MKSTDNQKPYHLLQKASVYASDCTTCFISFDLHNSMMWPPRAGEGLERGCDFSRASARKQRSWDSNYSNFILDIWFLLHSFINSKCLLLSGIALKKKKKGYYWQIWRQKPPCSSENNFLMARAVHRWDRPSNEVSSSPPLHRRGWVTACMEEWSARDGDKLYSLK